MDVFAWVGGYVCVFVGVCVGGAVRGIKKALFDYK